MHPLQTLTGIKIGLNPARLCRRIVRLTSACRYAGSVVRLHQLHLSHDPAGTNVQPHTHGYYEAIFILRGRGRELIAPLSALRTGTVQFHPPHCLHGWRATSDIWRFGVWFDLLPAPPPAPGVALPPYTDYPAHLAALLRESRTDRIGRGERLAARLILLLAPLLNTLAWPPAPSAPEASDPPLPTVSDLVNRFLQDNLARPITLRDVAQQVNMSIPALVRMFRRETGDTVMHRLHTLRMRQAARLLQESPASAKEIGVRIGLPEPAYFGRCFRRHFGQSPQRWRQQAMREMAPAPPVDRHS